MLMDRIKQAEFRDMLLETLGLKAAGNTGYKHDASGTPTAIYAHGPEGVFTFPGVDAKVFSAYVGVESGVIGVLPKFPSVFTHPVYTSITGVQDDTGSEAVQACDNAPVAGLLKTCKLSSVFGRYQRSTREIYLDRLGMYVNTGDPNYLQMQNWGGEAVPGIPQDMLHPALAPNGRINLNSEMQKVLLEFGVSFTRQLARQMYVGSPANNSVVGENAGYKELTGFDILINTGFADIETNTACPALDSDIKDFNFDNVDGSDTQDIVNVMTYMWRFLNKNARSMGFMPVNWVIAMREELFYEMTAVWPCRYDTYRCTTQNSSTQTVFINGRDEVTRRDELRNGRFLLIDGMRVPVVFDDGIAELNDTTSASLNAGEFASDIYFIPLTVMGGTPVTFMEYFQHDNPSLQEALNMARGEGLFTTNGGSWMWNTRRTNLCLAWQGKVEPRLVLRTPQLAGRVQNVKYVPLQHTRTAFPDDPYFADGGVTSRIGNGPSFYQPWQS